MPKQGTTRGRPVGLLANVDAIRWRLEWMGEPQSWLADRAGMSPGNLSDVLKGVKGVSEPAAHRIAAALDIPVGVVFPELVEFSTTVRHFTAPKAAA